MNTLLSIQQRNVKQTSPAKSNLEKFKKENAREFMLSKSLSSFKYKEGVKLGFVLRTPFIKYLNGNIHFLLGQ